MRRARGAPRAGVALLVVLALDGAGAAGASDGARGGVPAPASDLRSEFWRDVAEPGYRASRALMDQGLRLLAIAVQVHDPAEKARRLHSAIARLELAHRRAPDDPQALYYLAVATAALEVPRLGRPPERRDGEAIERFLRLRALDPDFYADRVAFELGILFTRTGRLAEAAAEYRNAILRAFDESEAVSAHSNLGEVSMLHGALEDAVAHYDRAIELARRGGPSQGESLALALWGSAVALHRLGERDAGIERAGAALSAGGGTADVLRAEGVFFEPPYEIHYYEALGHLARAETLAGAEAARATADAARSFERFLRYGGSTSIFAEAARRELARLRPPPRRPGPP